MPRRLTIVLALLTSLLALPAHAQSAFSLEAELLKPGVRLVAVEFYSTHCKPCMDAVPRWEALHQKYRDKGLRLLVVAVMDDQKCVNPGWHPDRVICDDEGQLAQSMQVNGLPAAFLWSWTGRQLVERGDVASVTAAIERELATLPRVALQVEPGGPSAALVRAELSRSGKLEVVASAAEKKLLDDVRRESQKAGYAENTQCKLGEELAANSVLKVSVDGGRDPRLYLHLMSAEKGCVTAVGAAPWQASRPEQSVAAAVTELLERLRTPPQMSGPAPRPVTKQPFGGSKVEAAKSVETEELEETVVKFASTPAASVHLGDKMLCKSTPCQKSVPLGKQNLTMSAEDYVTRTESLNVTKATKLVDWPLQADFATLSLTCGGETVNVKVDGESMSCPLQAQRLKPGKHRVVLESACFLGVEEAFEVKRGDVKTLALTVTPRLGVVTVKAQNDAGDDLTGTALLDGQPLGEVPGSFKVPVCGKQLEVRSDGHASWSAPLKVAEGEKVRVVAALQKRVAERPVATAVASGPTAAVTQEQVNAAKALGKGVFRDNGDGTVSQTDVGLVWQQADSVAALDWQAAFAYCAGLNLRGGGWRLPGVLELLRLIDRTKPVGKQVDGAFRNSSPYFWSASPWVSGGAAWYVSFDYGYGGAATSRPHRVRCVR